MSDEVQVEYEQYDEEADEAPSGDPEADCTGEEQDDEETDEAPTGDLESDYYTGEEER